MKKCDLGELIRIMAKLREPEGCPWDREQTLETLKDYLVEESYEVLEAINMQDMPHLQEELGDLLYQIIFISRVCEEEGAFTIDDVISGISAKIKRRHPHVFGSEKVNSSGEVLVRWEEIKMEEKNQKEKPSTLSGIPEALPAILKAKRISEKVARVGFDWEKISDLMEKLHEELSELMQSIESFNKKEIEEEIGDLLFVMVNIGRKLQIDPEAALQRCNRKFMKRFEFVEERLKMRGKRPGASTLAEMEELWKEAKAFD